MTLHNPKRRQALKALTAGALATGLSACGGDNTSTSAAGTAAKQRFRWKMTTTWPPNFPIFQEGVERFAKAVQQMSNDQLQIHVFAAGELVPALQSFDAVAQGQVEMGHGAAYYWTGKIPAAAFFTAVPFGLNAQGMNAWLYQGGGLELWHKLYAKHGLIAFPMGNTGVQMGGWFRKAINGVDDLKGLKMRIPGLGGKVMAKAGVNPVLMPGGEIYTALERGTLDATEWVGPFHDLRMGLQRAAKHYYYPGWHEPGPCLELSLNLQAWQKLPAALQETVREAAAASNLWMLSEFEARNHEALQTLIQKHGVQVQAFPDALLRQLKAYTAEVLQEESAKDTDFKAIHTAYQAFQAQYAAWNAISEGAYAKTLNL